MSTHGAIEWKQDGELYGVYISSTAEPEYVGLDIFVACKEKGVDKVVEELKKMASWEQFEYYKGVCPYCGQWGSYEDVDYALYQLDPAHGQNKWREIASHIKRGDKAIEDIQRVLPTGNPETFKMLKLLKNIAETGFPDSKMKHHKHLEEGITPDNIKDCEAEFIYILVPKKNLIKVIDPYGYVIFRWTTDMTLEELKKQFEDDDED